MVEFFTLAVDGDKITFTDTTGATTTFDGSKAVNIIKSQYDFLLRLKSDGRVPSEALLDDIAAYEFIMNNPHLADQYFEYKSKKPITAMRAVRYIVRELGWINDGKWK